MRRLYARKVNVLNGGGRSHRRRGCNIAYDSVVTTNCEKSAEAIVAIREMVKGRTDESSSKEEELQHLG